MYARLHQPALVKPVIKHVYDGKSSLLTYNLIKFIFTNYSAHFEVSVSDFGC